MPSVFSNAILSYSLRLAFLLKLKHTGIVRLVGQQDPEIPLFPPPSLAIT